MSLAIVIIASEKRRETTFPRCLESVREQEPEEIAVVADFPCQAKGVRSLVVPPMTRTTNDALVKRDVGWLATTARHVMYLCDDHALSPHFVEAYREVYQHEWNAWDEKPWDILVPSRYCEHEGQFTWLEVGQKEGYAGGHAAIYKRICGYLQPWSATEHHPNWDVLHTRQLVAKGMRLVFALRDLPVIDMESDAKPWHMTEEQRRRHEAFHQSLGVV